MPSLFSEYLSPTNPIASVIVTILQCSFSVWCGGLVAYWIWLLVKKKEIEKKQNIQPLVTARQERDLGREDNEAETDAEKVFQEFCKKSFLERSPIPFLGKPSSITKHLKAIFLAGWDESRLEVSELINHTTSNLFRWNSLFRSVLAVFIVIGLLGTLFGLTDSLKDLSPALKESAVIETPTENSERMTQALGNLMDHIKGAFAPSIWGIIFTIAGVILYGVYLQIACHPVKSILEQLTLTAWVPQLYPTTSQKLTQTLQQGESQIQKGFETAAQFSESVKKVHNNIDEFNESLTQASAITQPLSDSVTQINKAASHISTAADVLNTGFTESLDKFSKEFSSSVTHLTGFQDEIRSLHQQFQEASNQKLDQQTQKLDDQTQNLVKVLNALKGYEDAYIASREQIDETLQKFINVATEANTSIHDRNREWFEKINADNHERFSEMRGQLKTDLTELGQTLGNELKTLADVLATNLKNVQGSLDERLEVLNDRLENFDTPLKEVAEQIRETFDTQLETLNDRLSNFDKPLREAVDQIRETFDTQLETLNDRLENFYAPLQNAADQIRGTFQNLVTHMRTIVGGLQIEIKEQNKSYEEQLTGVKNLNESVVNLLNQLDESSNNQQAAVNALSTNVGELTADTQNLAAAITSFTSDSGTLSHSVAAIEKHAGTLGTASQQFVEKVEKADVTPLTANIGRLNTAINEISQNSRTLANAVNTLAKQGSSSGSERKPKRSFFGRIRNRFSRKKTSEQTSAESQSKNEGK